MSHDQTFWHIKWKHKLRPIYGPSLSTIPFVYGELLKKNHIFKNFDFFWKNSPLPHEKFQKKYESWTFSPNNGLLHKLET